LAVNVQCADGNAEMEENVEKEEDRDMVFRD
jgi:hypothetical protein